MRKQKILVVIIGILVIAATWVIVSIIPSNRKNQDDTTSETPGKATDQFTETPAQSVSEPDSTESDLTAESTSDQHSESESSNTGFEPIMTENNGEIEIVIPDDQEGEGF